jgi:ribose 5-phosphate isomerase A
VDDFVTSDTVVGLGTGSTAAFAVERVGSLLSDKTLKGLKCIPTSEATKDQATGLKIPLVTLDEESDLAVCIDGADAVDAQGNLVKGGGGALLREKMVAARAKDFIVIVDESKMTEKLGSSFPLPVEVVPFCAEHTMRVVAALPSIAGSLDYAEMRMRDGKVYLTDNGNQIVDLHFKDPYDPLAVGAALEEQVGVVEHGLFLGMTSTVIVAGKDGVYSIDHSKNKK